jgi:hypothetical protein
MSKSCKLIIGWLEVLGVDRVDVDGFGKEFNGVGNKNGMPLWLKNIG